MKIKVENGIGIKKIEATGYSLKGVSVKGVIDRLELRINGNIVYTFANSERLSEFSDNNIDIPLVGELEIRVFASDGTYEIILFLQPYLFISSVGAYMDLRLRA